ncbi:MAG: GNAT family N-acetyltransferase [Solirubrobacteraceae bacterium]
MSVRDDSALANAVELDRRIYTRGGQERTDVPGGCVVRHRDLATVHFLNCLRMWAPLDPAVGAAQLIALAERGLGDLGHRLVVLEDGAAGERVSGDFAAAGWERRRTVMMVLGSGPPPAPRDPRAREISGDALRGLQLAALAEEDFGPDSFPGLPRLLADAQAALRDATPARGFGAGDGGALASTCTLFLEDNLGGRRAAMLEHVATLRDHRERGLAKAAVGAALHAAADWGAELIVVPADADDWPQLLYAGLGFVAVGRTAAFTLRVSAPV